MEWHDLLKGALGSSPVALVLGFAVWKLWTKLEAKDAEIKGLNTEIRQTLIDVSRRSDDD